MNRQAPPPTRPATIPAGIGYHTYEGGIDRFNRATEPMQVDIYQEFSGWACWYQYDRFGIRYQCKVATHCIAYEGTE